MIRCEGRDRSTIWGLFARGYAGLGYRNQTCERSDPAQDSFARVTAPELLAELDRALEYPKLQRYHSVEDRARFVALVMALSELVDLPETGPRNCRDRDDDRVLACAVVGADHEADAFSLRTCCRGNAERRPLSGPPQVLFIGRLAGLNPRLLQDGPCFPLLWESWIH